MTKDKLPVNKNKKRFNKSSFIELANKVRKILEKEDAQLHREEIKHGINSSPKLSTIS